MLKRSTSVPAAMIVAILAGCNLAITAGQLNVGNGTGATNTSKTPAPGSTPSTSPSGATSPAPTGSPTAPMQFIVSTFAGSGVQGVANGASSSAQFTEPQGLAIDSSGNLYVADYSAHRIRKVTPTGTVSTLAGSGTPGYQDGPGASAEFDYPPGVAVDSAGNVYVSDGGFAVYGGKNPTNRIRKITPDGFVSTVAGAGPGAWLDGASSSAEFWNPAGMVFDPRGNLFVADAVNHRIRKIASGGPVSTVAGGDRTGGFPDGKGDQAELDEPWGLARDDAGNLYVTNYIWILKVAPDGTVSRIAGPTSAAGPTQGYQDGPGDKALFQQIQGIARDAEGNLFVTDAGNRRIRMIAPDGTVSTVAGDGATPPPRSWTNCQSGPCPEPTEPPRTPGSPAYRDGLGLQAEFNGLDGITIDASGNLYVADTGNYCIRKLTRVQ